MAMSTIYDKNYSSPPSISDEVYNNVGASAFTLGDAQRFFKGSTDLIIRTASGGGGTLLVENTDYTLNISTAYTTEAGYNVYATITMDNVTYQTGNLYISYKPVFSLIEAATINDIISDITTLQSQTTAVNYLTKTADYTILDADLDGYSKLIIFADSSSGALTITFPTLADNQNKEIQIISTDLGGKITLDGEGAETIGGYSSLYLQSKNDKLSVVGEAGEWQILSYSAKYETGWINTNDWTDRHLGSSTVTYDNLSGTFTVGEVITEATSGNTGIIQSDTGSVLILKNVTGTGIFTDGRELTGSTSGATADVNETTSNKNANSNVFHDFGFNIPYLRTEIYMSKSTTGTDATAIKLADFSRGDYFGNPTNGEFRGIDSDSVQMQTSQNGFFLCNDSGDDYQVSSSDFSYKIIIEAIL